MNRAFVAVLAALAGVLVAAGPATAAPATQPAANAGFVTRTGSTLKLDGKPFRFGGTNNYYLFYKSRAMVDDVFADARAAGFDVMRTWAFGLIGNADVRVLWVYLNPGTVDLDNVRLE